MAEATHTLLDPPKSVGDRYLVGRSVGAGSSGTVYLAEDSQTGKPCALKIREAKDREQPVRFIAEAQDMKRLRHPRLVPVLDYGNDGRLYWYVMPFYAKGCLRDQVKKSGPLEPAVALDWVFQMLEGLSAVHEAGLVHRDVKPHNVLIGDDGKALLADFGLARHIHGGVPYRTRTDQSMGTPNYRAPEQAADAANVDLRADIYGIGATLYFLLTGRRPGFLFMVNPDDPLMAAVPESLREFVLQCMAHTPADRFSSARSCAFEVAMLVDSLPNRSGPPVGASWIRRFDALGKQSWLDRLWGWMRR
ncbi:MAG: serine/threonine-protein kinase [Myxococcota bacterium]